MATNLRTQLSVSLSWLFRNIDSDSGRTVTDAASMTLNQSLADGLVLNSADLLWHDRRTVNDSSDDDLDLAGVLSTSFGSTATFAKVKGIYIANLNTEAGDNLVVGGDGSAGFTSWLGDPSDKVVIGPGGLLLLWNPSLAGYAVTATTADILRLTGSGGNITYDIALVGTTA